MKNWLSHTASFCSLGFLLLPFVCIVALQGAQWYLGESAMERMEHHQPLTLSFPASKAVWHKKGKEISVEGRLFDVQQYNLSDGILTVTGFYDDEEAELVRLLSLLITNRKSTALLQYLFLLQCFTTPLLLFSFAISGQERLDHAASFCIHLPRPFCLIAEQPPKY